MPRTTSRRALWLAPLLLLATQGTALAADNLRDRLGGAPTAAKLIGEQTVRAAIRDGLLLGSERTVTKALANGGIRIVAHKRYPRMIDPKDRRAKNLPEPVTVTLRAVIRADYRLGSMKLTRKMPRSVDQAFGYAFTEEYPGWYEWDTIEWKPAGRKLVRTLKLKGKLVKRDELGFDSNSFLLELTHLQLLPAVKQGLSEFYFDAVIEGNVHGIHAEVQDRRQVEEALNKYSLNGSLKKYLRFDHPVKVIEMKLNSPFKRAFFPHRFYAIYEPGARPKLLGFIGGDPDDAAFYFPSTPIGAGL